VVTSGDYERCFDLTACVIIISSIPSPAFRRRAPSPSRSSRRTATLADGLSTTLFHGAPERARDILRSFPGCVAIIYYRDGDGIVSLKSMGMKQFLVKEYECHCVTGKPYERRYKVSRTTAGGVWTALA
jgi:thiamine biosynthesis lipoprotein ApbE